MSLQETEEEGTDTERTPHEGGGRDWNEAATSQGVPRATRSWERQRRRVPQNLQKERSLAGTSILDFWPLRE